MAQCSVLRQTHAQNDTSLARVPNTRTHTDGETHIEESTKGGGRRRRPPPFVEAARSAACSICVSPWVPFRVFGTPGQRCIVLPMGFPMGLSTEHCTICPFVYGCPNGSEPCTMKLPLCTIVQLYQVHVMLLHTRYLLQKLQWVPKP